MENKANYALIGSFVIIAVFAAVAFISWLSNSQFDQQFDEYEVVFTGPVRGLSRGSEVRYNGLRVGEVLRLAWDKDDNNTVIAYVQVVENTPVHIDSIAQLEPQGLTGLNYIQITTGPSGEMFRGRGPYQISGRMSQLDNFLDSGGSVIESTQKALNRVNVTLSEDAINDFHGILSNINDITGRVSNAEVDAKLVERVLVAFEQAALDVSEAALSTDKAARDFDALVNGDVKDIIARAEVTMAELDKMLVGITKFADGATVLTADSRDAINRISNSGLTDLEETAEGLRRLVRSVNAIVDKLDQNPVSFIAGEERETMEIPQ